MSEIESTESGVTENTESGNQNTSTKVEVNRSAEDYAKRVVELAAENKKRKQQESQLKAELESARKKLLEIEEGQVSEQGKYKEGYEKIKTEFESEKKKYKERVQAFAFKTVTDQVSRVAMTMGCNPTHVNDMITLAQSRGLLNDLDPDADFNLSDESVKSVVEKAQTMWPIYFTKTAPLIKTGTVTSAAPQTPNANDLSLQDKIKKLAEMTASKH
jgi:hypothetical protein